MRRLIRFILSPIRRRIGHALDVRFRDSEERIVQRLHGVSPDESFYGPQTEVLIYLGRHLRDLREELQEQRHWLAANTALPSNRTDVTSSERGSQLLSLGAQAVAEAFVLSITAQLESGSRVLVLGHPNANFSAALALNECRVDFEQPSSSASSRTGRPEAPGSITATHEPPEYDAIIVTEDPILRNLQAEKAPLKIEPSDELIRSCMTRLRSGGLWVICSPMDSPLWKSLSNLENQWITVDSRVIPVTSATPRPVRSPATSTFSQFMGRSDLYGLVALHCREKGAAANE